MVCEYLIEGPSSFSTKIQIAEIWIVGGLEKYFCHVREHPAESVLYRNTLFGELSDISQIYEHLQETVPGMAEHLKKTLTHPEGLGSSKKPSREGILGREDCTRGYIRTIEDCLEVWGSAPLGRDDFEIEWLFQMGERELGQNLVLGYCGADSEVDLKEAQKSRGEMEKFLKGIGYIVVEADLAGYV